MQLVFVLVVLCYDCVKNNYWQNLIAEVFITRKLIIHFFICCQTLMRPLYRFLWYWRPPTPFPRCKGSRKQAGSVCWAEITGFLHCGLNKLLVPGATSDQAFYFVTLMRWDYVLKFRIWHLCVALLIFFSSNLPAIIQILPHFLKCVFFGINPSSDCVIGGWRAC